jgi:hypothetical protein
MTSLLSRSTLLTLLLSALVLAEDCQAVKGIFKAGFWVGIGVSIISADDSLRQPLVQDHSERIQHRAHRQ